MPDALDRWSHSYKKTKIVIIKDINKDIKKNYYYFLSFYTEIDKKNSIFKFI